MNSLIEARRAVGDVEISEEPILFESYFGVVSTVFNESHLGSQRERSGVIF